MLTEIGEKARAAARILSLKSTEEKNRALSAAASALEENKDFIKTQNAIDLDAGKKSGLSEALLDRLSLTDERIAGMASGIRAVAELDDPVGRVLSEKVINGMRLVKTSVPIGVIAVIYESRPNVTADSAALCLKSGNTVILRGGKEAINSNLAVANVMRAAIEKTGLPADCIMLVPFTGREGAEALMKLNGYVDVLIPRGGRELISTVVKNSTVPVIETGAGVCHVYVDKAADVKMAADIVYNAKTSRPSVCNACECVLVHRDIAKEALLSIAAELRKKNVEIRGDAETLKILPDAVSADESDWGAEYNDFIIAVKIVGGISEAVEHIFRYGTAHSDCIVTEDAETAERFLNEVDSAAVYHNASTRFTDGGEFGLGAEIGISTQKLHARGPLGLNELTSVKYKAYGNGHIRATT
ncbi:MAG: glutamate-5-semialdehyde dehydrogenase [Oscillospiraceae bacterium]|nr:glutamate-5-semialdehyde dehydrogenase [Oscillospiraceae bacterium]